MKFLTEHWIDVFFVGMLLISVLTHNKTLVWAMAAVFLLRLFHAQAALEYLAGHGINVGILIITIGFLAPIALGRYTLEQFLQVFTTPVGWVAVACGILVALMGARGVAVGQTDIVITAGIILGTFCGVAFFKGSPVGPLIGSGMAYMVIWLIRRVFPI